LPCAWVRGAILIRINSFLRGHSCVRWDLIERLAALLRARITPNVPLQGSISASGDLAPLAYVAFALAGHPSLTMTIYKPGPISEQDTAQGALRSAGIQPYSFAPKEVLALINGTAVSAAVAADALGSAHTLLLLAQVVTVVHTEAMLGFRAPFESFLHDVARPHTGQCQIAENLRNWLSDSSMLQDREQSAGIEYPGPVYAIRTAPQWLGPVLEDFVAAHETLTTELNSSTDNPLFDPTSKQLYHGGNFQAAAVTNAVEKIRDGLSTIGRLIFAQQSELLNPQRSNGLPTCLAPSLGPNKDGGLKGIDIANASYLSELNFLANRVNHFVQSAEMDNQSVNSLALISARFTVMAAEVLKKLMANAVYGVLQAIDLR
ncbi:Phenylalanine/histidine ammonia-lyase, partial [Microstroma glucosiphilum]